jgi:hypothetical protein
MFKISSIVLFFNSEKKRCSPIPIPAPSVQGAGIIMYPPGLIIGLLAKYR